MARAWTPTDAADAADDRAAREWWRLTAREEDDAIRNMSAEDIAEMLQAQRIGGQP